MSKATTGKFFRTSNIGTASNKLQEKNRSKKNLSIET